MNAAVRRALKRADLSVIGVGQGHQTPHSAFAKQVEAAEFVRRLGVPHKVMRTVDVDGERGVVVVPKLSEGMTRDLGKRYGQRSVLVGNKEVSTESGLELTAFGSAMVSEKKPAGFWTFIPEQRLYFSLVPVKAHLRKGRPVAGYAARRKRRAR